MHHRGPAAVARDRARPRQERGLTAIAFVGGFPTADFQVSPALPEIAFLGRSNVGKSSLLNALVGRRAIARTSRTPGKTRMANVYAVDDAYYLVDLPGYGYARLSKTERRKFLDLLDTYLTTRERIAGVVWLLDVRHDPSRDDVAMAARLIEIGVPALVAITKADKVPRGRRAQQAATIREAVNVPPDQCVVTSAKTHEGIDTLRESVAALVRSAQRRIDGSTDR